VDFSAYLLSVVVSYFIGSIPTGYLVGRAKGLDIRKMGSGNIGATNAFRILGKGAGAFVLLADASKGYLSCWLVPLLAVKFFPAGNLPNLALTAGVSAILGHNYTCWLRFKGGKGVATTAGVLLAMAPEAALTTLGAWAVVFCASRYVSLASIMAAAVLPFAAWYWNSSKVMIGVFAALGALAVYKHKSNIQRLLNGTESRIGAKKNVKEPTK
jgi:acyl phosphate:glycerol-3-phosphate acyltransferase